MDAKTTNYVTLKVKLKASINDTLGCITYIFKNLDKNAPYYYKYIMCVRFSNWEHRHLNLGEQGYLTYKPVIAGEDQWFDGNTMQYYNYTNNIFINFIQKPDKIDKNKVFLM